MNMRKLELETLRHTRKCNTALINISSKFNPSSYQDEAYFLAQLLCERYS